MGFASSAAAARDRRRHYFPSSTPSGSTSLNKVLVPHTIGSSEWAQTSDPNQQPENFHEPLNLTLDLEHAHVSGRTAWRRERSSRFEFATWRPCTRVITLRILTAVESQEWREDA
jgi:hypothetical protein